MNEQMYSELVIELHDIARKIENSIGKGLLSEDIRNCADRLHELTKQVV
jgi:hypothetical protein